MNRSTIALALLAVAMPVQPAEDITMWGCTTEGGRRNVLYLADRGARSYVKFGTQRVAARVTVADSERIWSFGHNKVLLRADGSAEYFEAEALKSRFKCKPM